jgi:hypothetical protein
MVVVQAAKSGKSVLEVREVVMISGGIAAAIVIIAVSVTLYKKHQAGKKAMNIVDDSMPPLKDYGSVMKKYEVAVMNSSALNEPLSPRRVPRSDSTFGATPEFV